MAVTGKKETIHDDWWHKQGQNPWWLVTEVVDMWTTHTTYNMWSDKSVI